MITGDGDSSAAAATGSGSRGAADSGHSQLYLKLCSARAKHSAESHHSRHSATAAIFLPTCHQALRLSQATGEVKDLLFVVCYDDIVMMVVAVGAVRGDMWIADWSHDNLSD